MANDEKRYLFSAKRVTVTRVSGYVEATDPDAARARLEANRGVIEIESVGPIDSQTFEEIRVNPEPLSDDE